MPYRSTNLRLVERHCAHALELYESGAWADHSATHRGTAAHALLHAAGLEADRLGRGLTETERHDLGREIVVKLATEGREFEGQPESPLSLPAVEEGVELGIEWCAEHGDPPAGEYELPLAVDREGKPVKYGGAKHYDGAVVDSTWIDEGPVTTVRVLRDYKSAWSAGPQELTSYQLRGQAAFVVAHGMAEGCDELRLEVANLRTRKIYSETLYLGHESGRATLERWRLARKRLLDGLEKIRDKAGGYPASPGAGCMGCPYLGGSCAAANALLKGEGLPDSATERARLYGVLAGRFAQVKEAVVADADEGPIRVEVADGGTLELGWHAKPTRRPGEFIGSEVWSAWKRGDGQPEGMIHALNLGVTNLQAVARVLHPRDRAAQEAWLDQVTVPAERRSFEWKEVE